MSRIQTRILFTLSVELMELYIQHVWSCYLECHFISLSKALQGEKEPQVQTAKLHKQHFEEEIIIKKI